MEVHIFEKYHLHNQYQMYRVNKKGDRDGEAETEVRDC